MLKDEYGRSMQCRHMYPALGLKNGHHLPTVGVAPQVVQGYLVYVKAANGPKPNGRKSSAHRVIVVCSCGQHVPFGRMVQHEKGRFHKEHGSNG